MRETPLSRAPQRPRVRDRDVLPGCVPFDRSNPTSPAGTDPALINGLLRMETARRGRHGDACVTYGGSWRWPVR